MEQTRYGINNILTVVFTTFSHYLLYSVSKKFYISSKRKLQELVDTGINKNTQWLEIPLGRAGWLLKLLSLSSFFGVCAFLFRTRSTLSLHSL